MFLLLWWLCALTHTHNALRAPDITLNTSCMLSVIHESWESVFCWTRLQCMLGEQQCVLAGLHKQHWLLHNAIQKYESYFKPSFIWNRGVNPSLNINKRSKRSCDEICGCWQCFCVSHWTEMMRYSLTDNVSAFILIKHKALFSVKHWTNTEQPSNCHRISFTISERLQLFLSPDDNIFNRTKQKIPQTYRDTE